jgi:hypothetical protein
MLTVATTSSSFTKLDTMQKILTLSILALFLLSGIADAASIIIEDADEVWDPALSDPSFNLNIKPRIQLEYVDSINSIWHPELNDTPDDLDLDIKPRILLKYVDSINSIWHPELNDTPDDLNLNIKPRIMLEYVDSINSIWHPKLVPKDAVTDAEIIDWSINNTIFNPGDCVVANVTIKNTGNLSHEFYIGFSVYDPDGTYIAEKYDAPFTSVYLNKDDVSTEVLTWKVPPDAKEGKWDATVAVWDREEGGLLYGEYDRKTKEDAFEILQVIAFRTVIKPSDGEWGVDKDYKVDIYDTSRRAPNPIGDVCKLLGGGYECDVLAFSGTFYFSDTDHDGELSIEEISKAIGEEVDDLLKKKLAEYAWKVHLVSSYLALKGSEASIGSAAAAGAPSGVSGFAIPVPTGAISSIFGYMNLEGNPIFSGFINMDQNIFQANCPVNLTVIDQCGRMVSNNGTNQIPNASVIIIGETKTFYLPTDLTYSVSVDAYDVGTFNFTSITPVTDGILITGFMNVSITENTTATLEVEPGEAIHTMKIDYDGDGEIDEEKSPDVNETITAPPRGDLNSDGILTPADAAIALEIAVGSRPCDPATLAAADVSGDNLVTSLDALMILQAAADAITL